MKKKLVGILIVVLMLISGCNGNYTYETMLYGEPTEAEGVFKKEALGHYSERQSTKLENSEEETVNLGNKSVVAVKTEIQTVGDESYDYYRSVDGNELYKKRARDEYFLVSAQNGAVLSYFSGGEITEKSLKEHVISYISEYVDTDFLIEYEYTCTTKVNISTENSLSNKEEASFYSPKDSTESVKYYEFVFRKYCGKYATEDNVTVRCLPNGNINHISYENSRVNWEEFTANSSAIEKDSKSFLKEAISDKYRIEKYNLERETLSYISGKVCLLREYEVMLSDSNGEIGVLVPILLFNK